LKLNRLSIRTENVLESARIGGNTTYTFVARSYEMYFMLHATIIGENYSEKEVATNMFNMRVYALEVTDKSRGYKTIEFVTGLDLKSCVTARDYIVEYKLAMEDIQPALEGRKVLVKGRLGLELQDAPIPNPEVFDNRDKAEVRRFTRKHNKELFRYAKDFKAIKNLNRMQLEIRVVADSEVGEDARDEVAASN
jgi:hypothetical protein